MDFGKFSVFSVFNPTNLLPHAKAAEFSNTGKNTVAEVDSNPSIQENTQDESTSASYSSSIPLQDKTISISLDRKIINRSRFDVESRPDHVAPIVTNQGVGGYKTSRSNDQENVEPKRLRLSTDPQHFAPHPQQPVRTQPVEKPTTKSIVAANLDEFAQVVEKLRGRSQAKSNCTHLARDFLHYLLTGTRPEKASNTKPSHSKDFFVDPRYEVNIKDEKAVVFIGYSKITQIHTDHPVLIQADTLVTDGVVNVDTPAKSWKIDDYIQPSAHYLKINTVLKDLAAQSEWGVSFGLINLGTAFAMSYALVAMSTRKQPLLKQIEFRCDENCFHYRLMRNDSVITHSLPWEQLPADMPREPAVLIHQQFYFLSTVLKALQNLGHIQRLRQSDAMQLTDEHQLVYFVDASGVYYIDPQFFKYQGKKPVPVSNYISSDLTTFYDFTETWGPIIFYASFSPKIEQEEEIYIKPNHHETNQSPEKPSEILSVHKPTLLRSDIRQNNTNVTPIVEITPVVQPPPLVKITPVTQVIAITKNIPPTNAPSYGEIAGILHNPPPNIFFQPLLPTFANQPESCVADRLKMLSKLNQPFNAVDYFEHIFDQIEALDLRRQGLTNAEIRILSDVMEDNRTIKSLNLSDNNFDDQGIVALASKLINNKTLTELVLESVRSSGLVALENLLQQNHTLVNLGSKVLDIIASKKTSVTQFTDRFIEDIRKLLTINTQISQIRLDSQRRTEQAASLEESESQVMQLIVSKKKALALSPFTYSGPIPGGDKLTPPLSLKKYLNLFMTTGRIQRVLFQESIVGILLAGGTYGTIKNPTHKLPEGIDRFFCLHHALSVATTIDLSRKILPPLESIHVIILIRFLKNNGNLTSLIFPKCAIGDLGVLMLWDVVQSNKALEILKVDDSGLTSAGKLLYAKIEKEMVGRSQKLLGGIKH